jgi:hypothetical protein
MLIRPDPEPHSRYRFFFLFLWWWICIGNKSKNVFLKTSPESRCITEFLRVKGQEGVYITTSSSRMGAVFSRIESGGRGDNTASLTIIQEEEAINRALQTDTHTGIIYRQIPNMFRIQTSLCSGSGASVISLPPGSVRNIRILTISLKIQTSFRKNSTI